MTKEEYINTKIGDKVLIGGNSKFKGQIGTVVKIYSYIPTSRQLTIYNDLMGARKFCCKNIQILKGDK